MLEIKINYLDKKDPTKEETIEELSGLLMISPEVDSIEVDEGDSYVEEDEGGSLLGDVMDDGDFSRNRSSDLRNIMYSDEELEAIKRGDKVADEGPILFNINKFLGDWDEEDGETLSDTIIGKQLRGHKKRKKNDDEYTKEFADEFTLLYDSLKDYDKLERQIETIVGLNNKSRTRNASKYINDGIANLITLKNQRLATIKEIVSMKKIINDLRMKSEKSAGEDIQSDMGLAGSSFLQQVLSSGRSDLVNAVTDPEINAANLLDSEDGVSNINQVKQISDSTYSSDEQERINDMIAERLMKEGNPSRSSEGNRVIKYESVGAKVKVRRFIDTDEYEFFAIDKNNNEIHDYPVPDVNDTDVGELQFSGKIAVDRRGVQYRVEEVYDDETNDPEMKSDYYNE